MERIDNVIRVTRAGQTVEDVSCRRIIVQAPRTIIRRVEVTGDATKSNHGLIDFTHASAAGTITDATIRPSTPTLWQTGVLGHDFTARGVTVRHTVDGFGVYNTHKPTDGRVDVLIDDCDVDDLVYFTNDPNHSDRHTHNDAVQVQGGSYVTIRNSRLRALLDTTVGNRGPWGDVATGQAIGVTPNVSKVSWLHVQGNDLDGGAQAITLIPGKFGRVNLGTIQENTFGRHSKRRTAAAHPDVSVTWKGNIYEDGKTVSLTVTRDL
jgi:hypothetical protein